MKLHYPRLNLAICAGLMALGMSSGAVTAAVFLSVDFESANGPFPAEGDTETGFQPFTNHNGAGRTYTTTEGSIFVNVLGEQPAGDDGYFDRGPIADTGSFTYGDLYRDFAFNNNEKQMDFTLTGLLANTVYSLTWFSYDSDGAHNVSFAGISGSSGSAALSYTGGVVPTENYDPDNSITALFTTDGTGGLTVRANDTGNLRVNGFEIATVVPEPSSAAILLLGLGVAAGQRRRRSESIHPCSAH